MDDVAGDDGMQVVAHLHHKMAFVGQADRRSFEGLAGQLDPDAAPDLSLIHI